MTTTTAIVTILALLLAQATPARRTKVRVYVSLAEYYGTVYVRPPSGGADHVLLRGQPLTARLSIANQGEDQEVRLRPSQSAPFKVHVAGMGSVEPLAQGVVAQPALLRGAGRQGPRALPTTLKHRESLHWDATVPNFQQLPAGHYRLKADAQVESTVGGSPEVNNDNLVIELRDVVGQAERVELLRITATRALRNNDYAQADAAARQLLAAYPQSAFAHMLIGDAAVARKDVNSARAAFNRASELLRGRGDTLYRAVATEHQVSETIEAMDMRIAALGGRGGRSGR
jgi:TolA-binding protein